MNGLVEIIALVVFLFLFVVGGYYFYLTFSGPRKIEEIDRLVRQGRYRDAMFQLRKVIEKDDRNLRARFLMARCLRKTEEPGAAVLELRQCLKIAKYTPEATEAAVRRELAQCLEEVNNLTEAKNEYLILTQIDAGNYDNWYHVGDLFFRASLHSKAVPYLKKAIALNARHADSLALLGQCEYHLAAYQEARAALAQAVQLKPDHTVGRYFLGLSLRYLGDHDWALKEFEKAEKDEGLKEKAILARGMTLIDMEAYPRALMELDRGLKIARAGTDTFLNMNYLAGIAAERSRDLGSAIKYWEMIEKLKPGFRDVRDKLKQYQEFRTDDAIKDLMIASSAQFEAIARSMLEGMGMHISSLRLVGDAAVEALTSESETNKRMMRKAYTLILIQREMNALAERHVREFHESMREKNASRGIIMTTGEVTPQALGFASSRPIEIYDSAKLADALKGVSVN